MDGHSDTSSSADQQITFAHDTAIEAAARRNGIPFHEAGMHTASELAESYGLEALLEAINIAGAGKAQTWAYVTGILRNKAAAHSKAQSTLTTFDVNPYERYRRNFSEEDHSNQTSSTWDVNPYAEYEGLND